MGKLILELDHSEARDLLLRPNSYCNFGLPAYFNMQNLLDCADRIVQKGGYRKSGKKSGPGAFEGVNYTLLTNKDGAYAWRPYELVHPILYVELVNLLTEEKNWNCIKERFKEMRRNDKIIAVNIPQRPDESEKNTEKEENIHRWWSETEQASIKLSLEFKYLTTTDITDCYGSLYTHSVAWALHDKKTAKSNRKGLDKKGGLLGNSIDNYLQDMHNRQTNGIPQGNMVSDLIAEIVLGFADMSLSEQLIKAKIEEYKILRYRDDYRIFTNSRQDAEKILLKLNSILTELNFKLNPNKTVIANSVIDASIRNDKINLISSSYGHRLGLQHQLLYIRNFAKIHKNSGSVSRLFGDFRKRIETLKGKPDQSDAMVAIVVDIMLNNPRTYATGASVISKLMSFDTKKERDDMYRKIERKFTDVPNVGYLDICLQRISIKSNRNREFDEPLCKLVPRKPIIAMLYENPIVASEMVDGISFYDIYNNYHESIDLYCKDESCNKLLLYCILVYEDMNRPRVIRKIENAIVTFFKCELTVGIAQVKSKKPLTDIESIKIAAGILRDTRDCDMYDTTEVKRAIGAYNSGETYSQTVVEIMNIVRQYFSVEDIEK